MARTPSKLTDLLLNKGISQDVISSNLRITQGDAKKLEDVKAALFFDAEPVSLIITGIGMVFTGLSDMISGKGVDKTICETTARTLVQAIETLTTKPFLAAISSTGITSGTRDVPIAMSAMYHMLLKVPHVDKKAMEEVILDAAKRGQISGYALVRPSFLTDGKEQGMQKIRVGSPDQPAVGYVISRDDVGLWLYSELINQDPRKWDGQKPSITY